MRRVTLFLFAIAVLSLVFMTGRAAAAVTTETGNVVVFYDSNSVVPDLLVYYPQEMFLSNSSMYFYVFADKSAAQAITSIDANIDFILEDGAQIGVGGGPQTSFTLNNAVVYVFAYETAPDWANSKKIVSYKIDAITFYVSCTSPEGQNSTWSQVVSANMTSFATFTKIEGVYEKVMTSNFVDAYIMPLFTNPTDNYNMNNTIVINNTTKIYNTSGYFYTWNVDMFIVKASEASVSANPAFIAFELGDKAVVTLYFFDALNPTLLVTQITTTMLYDNVYTVAIAAQGYESTTVVITASSNMSTAFSYTIYPATAIFSVSHYSVVCGYEGGLISDVIVISPRSSFTNNVTMQFINFPFIVTAVVDGSTSVATDNNLMIGAVNGDKTVTIIMSASVTTNAQAYIALVANDAFTGTASMSFKEFIAVSKVPFSMTTPAVWVLGTNYVRIANDTNTMTITFVVKNEGGTEIYNKIVTLTPLEIYTFSPPLDGGTNTVIINFNYVKEGIIAVPEAGQILFFADAHKQADISYETMTVTYDVVNTATVTITNPFAAVGTYTVFFAGNWDTETASKVVAVLPNSTASVEVYFSGPTNNEISAYEATMWVVFSDETVFSTTVPATATTNPRFFGTGISQNDAIIIAIGVVAVLLLVIAIRRGDEL